MVEKVKALCVKYREFLVYFIVGCLTTVVSWGCKFLWGAIFYAGVTLPTVGQNTVLSIVENVSGIAFAYPTNRRWVFQSRNPNILAEMSGFVGSRLATWALSYGLNLLLVNVFRVDYRITTMLVSVVVFVSNYVLSKLVVFKKKKETE
ncbi:MAG: GtrA family protein [Oscillospiraceae bacterium]|nr:GtrA family protein [Oscillospiraceae bacterium]